MSESNGGAVVPAYDLLLVTCLDSHPDTPLVRNERRLKEVGELDEVLTRLDALAFSVLLLTRVLGDGAEECDDGSFRLSLAADRAYIHLCDGGCSMARDPAREAETEATTQVMLDNGELIEVPHKNTVRYDDGVAAIRYWMAHGKQLPRVDWGTGKPVAAGGRVE